MCRNEVLSMCLITTLSAAMELFTWLTFHTCMLHCLTHNRVELQLQLAIMPRAHFSRSRSCWDIFAHRIRQARELEAAIKWRPRHNIVSPWRCSSPRTTDQSAFCVQSHVLSSCGLLVTYLRVEFYLLSTC
jgi:hypothetical protein